MLLLLEKVAVGIDLGVKARLAIVVEARIAVRLLDDCGGCRNLHSLSPQHSSKALCNTLDLRSSKCDLRILGYEVRWRKCHQRGFVDTDERLEIVPTIERYGDLMAFASKVLLDRS